MACRNCSPFVASRRGRNRCTPSTHRRKAASVYVYVCTTHTNAWSSKRCYTYSLCCKLIKTLLFLLNRRCCAFTIPSFLDSVDVLCGFCWRVIDGLTDINVEIAMEYFWRCRYFLSHVRDWPCALGDLRDDNENKDEDETIWGILPDIGCR